MERGFIQGLFKFFGRELTAADGGTEIQRSGGQRVEAWLHEGGGRGLALATTNSGRLSQP